MKRTVTILLACTLSVAHAQTVKWCVGGNLANGFTGMNSVYCDNAGKIIISGAFGAAKNDLIDIAGVPAVMSRGKSDGYVLSMNPDRTVNWIKQIGGNSMDIVTDGIADVYGNVYVVGLFEDSLWVDNQSIVSTGAGGWHTDMFLAKFSSSGTLQWLRHIKGINGDQTPYCSLGADASGNVYVAGAFSTDMDFGDGIVHQYKGGGLLPGDAFVSKYDVNGACVWVKIFHSPATETIKSLVVSPAGDVYVTGSFMDSLGFDGIVKISGGAEDIFLARLNATGDISWVKTLGDTGADLPGNIVLTPDNKLLLCATFQNSISIAPYQFQCAPMHAHNMLLAKFDSMGSISWARSYYVEIGTPKADVGKNGHIVFSGSFQLEAYLDNNILLESFDKPKHDGFVGICDTAGMVYKAFKSDQSELDDRIFDLDIDNENHIYAVGHTSDLVVYEGGHTAYVGGYALKIATDTIPKPTVIPGMHRVDAKVYPNPATEEIKWVTRERVEKVKLLNFQGQVVLNKTVGDNSLKLDDIPNGVYIIELVTASEIYQQVFIKE